MQRLRAVGEVAIAVPGRVRPHLSLVAVPLWPVAPNGHFQNVAVGASLGFEKLLPKLIFPKTFISF